MCTFFIIQGGLGNQMFQYAFYLSYKECNPHEIILFDTHYSKGCHSGFELFHLFPIKGEGKSHLSTLLLTSKLRKYIYRACSHPKEQNAYIYTPELLVHNGCFSWLEGYWQSELYFDRIASKVRDAFRFDVSMLNENSAGLLESIRSIPNSVSIHIRRGDYLTINGGSIVLPVSYYQKAIQLCIEKVPDAHFYVFSDDIPWVRENMDIPSATYVDWNNKMDSWQDMFLMSNCKHNIIANSSFSWWGAWLNANDQKLVIAPDWGDTDMIPKSWIQISSR